MKPAKGTKPLLGITRMVSARQIQDALGVGKTTLYRWIRQGEFPPPRRIGGTSRWPLDELNQWLRERPPADLSTLDERF